MKRVTVWFLTIMLGVGLLAGVPASVSQAKEIETEIQNYGVKADLIITNVNELKEFATDVLNGNTYAGETVVLANDIAFDGKEGNFEPIDGFGGTFDGQGYTISGIHVKEDKSGYGYGGVGFFRMLYNSTIVKNLTLKDCVFDGYNYVGAIAGTNAGIISDCAVIGTQISCVGESHVYAGGICALNESVIRNSYSMNSEIYAVTEVGYVVDAGGICGRNSNSTSLSKKAIIENCCNLSDVSSNIANIGGIAGYNSDSVRDCYNVGTLSIENPKENDFYMGGIAGFNFDVEEGVLSSYSLEGTVGLFCQGYTLTNPVETGNRLYPASYMQTAEFTNVLNEYVSNYSELNYWEIDENSLYPLPTKEIFFMSDCNMTLANPTCIYNGKEQTPGVVLTYNGKTLVQDIDYTVEYKNNVNAGTATVTVTGKHACRGTMSMDFEIQKAEQTFKYTKSYKKAYNSKAFKLNAKLQSGKGSLSYNSSNSKVASVSKKGKVTVKKIGTAIITVTASGTDNYKKTAIQIPVTVSPKKLTIKSAKISKNKLNVRWGKDSKAKGYEIQYSTNKNFKKGVTTVTLKKKTKVSYTSKKLKKGKKYYVRVRAYKGNIYGAWSKTVTVK